MIKCDHIIAMHHSYSGLIFSHEKNKYLNQEKDPENLMLTIFNFCPLCGHELTQELLKWKKKKR